MRDIDSYDWFHKHIRAWAKREISNLIVVGRGGFGKSWSVETVLEHQPHHWFSARVSSLFLYRELCDHPDWPVVFDDVGSVLRNAELIEMFKKLCEDGVSTLRWATTTKLLDGIPNSFRCSSPVIVLLNRLPERNEDVRAILDRCDGINFVPTKAQVIAYMLTYFPKDAEIINLLAQFPVTASMRALKFARQWARSTEVNMNVELLSEFGAPEGVVPLMDIMAKYPKKEWCRRFIETTGLVERTYQRHKLIAEDLLEARKSPDACRIVRLKSVQPTKPDDDDGQSDTGFSFRVPAGRIRGGGTGRDSPVALTTTMCRRTTVCRDRR